jgi:diguanylate cyclase (GGDEF)-like protein
VTVPKKTKNRWLFALKSNFKMRIILPTVIIMVVLSATMSFFSSVKFITFSNYLVDKNLAVDINALKLHLEYYKRCSITASTTMAKNPDAIKAIKSRDRKEIIRIFSQNHDSYQVNYYTITDEKGIVLGRTHEPDAYNDSVLNQKNVSDALSGKVSTYFEAGTVVRVSVRTGSPVYDHQGKLIGVVSAGIRLDTFDEVDNIKSLFGAEITIFKGDERIATTITDHGQRIVGTKMNPNIAKAVIEEKQEYKGDMTIYGNKYKVFYMPLLNSNNETFATFFLGIPTDEILHKTYVSMQQEFIIGLIGLIISIALLYFIISSISAPIIVMSKDMEDVANGNLDVKIDIAGTDEVGRLSTSIKKVIDIVHKLIDDITIMIDEHSKGNTDFLIDINQFLGTYNTLANKILELASFGMKDQLTGILNRRSFNNRLNMELTAAIAKKAPISFLIMDVDNFKRYNDTFGHQQGDAALQTVAKVLKKTIGSIDCETHLAARWGGEEFVALFSGIDSSAAAKAAELIRSEIEKAEIPSSVEAASRITVSIGANTQIPTENCTMDELVSQADERLYRAKEGGRNRVVCS